MKKNLLYIVDLKRSGLLKIGLSTWDRYDKRISELKRELKAPKLTLRLKTSIPRGWGTPRHWEQALLKEVCLFGGRLQLAIINEPSTEVVESSFDDALKALSLLRSKTEIDISKDADETSEKHEDWRFYTFMVRKYPEMIYDMQHQSLHYWKNPLNRQVFIHFLRGDEWQPMPERFLENG